MPLKGIDSTWQDSIGCAVGWNAIDLSYYDVPSSFNRSNSQQYIKVYFTIVRKNNGTGGYDTEKVEEMKEILDNAYNPLNIYFDYHCETEFLDNSERLENGLNPGEFCGWENVPMHSDGLDIFMVHAENDLSSTAEANGIAGGIPGKWLAVGEEGTIKTLPPSTIIHEVGHCLGLFHMFHGYVLNEDIWCPGEQLPPEQFINCVNGEIEYESDPNICVELVNGSNSDDCGDYIDGEDGEGTPASTRDHETENFGSDCTAGDNGDVYTHKPVQCALIRDPNGEIYQPDYTNYMSLVGRYSKHCRDHFKGGQVDVMHNMLNTHPDLQSILRTETEYANSCPCSTGDDIEITENTVYLDDKEFAENIIVRTGAKLTIESEVEMNEEKHIVVERGAKLIVDNGTLTKCPNGDSWGGIIVEGNSNLSQPSYTTMPQDDEAGIVWIKNNSLIEWARTAISTNYYGQWTNQKWGGLIHCENSTFEQNRRVAEFMKYDFENKSTFLNCTFDGGGAIDGETVGVTIWDTDGITFNKCRFYYMEKMGLETYDAGVIVKDGNDFHNNQTGVDAKATYPFNSTVEIGEMNVDPNYFLDNQIDITSNSSSTQHKYGLEVINNEFFGALGSILLRGPSTYYVEENSFENDVLSVNCYRTGALQSNPHTYIRNNAVVSDYYGIIANRENREMQFLCNDFQANWDFTLQNEGEIRERQGNRSEAAGNCFTRPLQAADINTVGNTDHFIYYRAPGEVESCKIPVTQGNYSVEQALNSSDCEEEDFTDNPVYQDYQNVKSQIDSMQDLNQWTTNQEAELAELLEFKDHILRTLVGDYVRNDEIDSALFILDEEQSVASQLMEYGLLCCQNEYDEALTTLNTLPDTVNGMYTFKQVQYINLDRMDSAGQYIMNSSDSSYLETVATGTSSSKGYAQAILGLLYGRTFYDHFTWPDTTGGGYKEKVHQTSDQDINVYPNPAEDKFTIDFRGYDVRTIRVVTIMGKTVYENTVSKDRKTIEVSTARWEDGIYGLQLQGTRGNVLYSDLLIVEK